MDLSQINEVSQAPSFLPTKQLKSLTLRKIYQIDSIRKCNTRYGVRFAVDLNQEFSCFLSSRVSKFLRMKKSKKYLENISRASEEGILHYRYLGGKCNDGEFIVKEIEDEKAEKDEEEEEDEEEESSISMEEANIVEN